MKRILFAIQPLVWITVLASVQIGRAGEFQEDRATEQPVAGAKAMPPAFDGFRSGPATKAQLNEAHIDLGAHQQAVTEPGGRIMVKGRTDNGDGKVRSTEGQRNLFAGANIMDENGKAIVLPNKATGEAGNKAGQKLAGLLEGGAGHLIYTVTPAQDGGKPTIVVNSMRSDGPAATAGAQKAVVMRDGDGKASQVTVKGEDLSITFNGGQNLGKKGDNVTVTVKFGNGKSMDFPGTLTAKGVQVKMFGDGLKANVATGIKSAMVKHEDTVYRMAAAPEAAKNVAPVAANARVAPNAGMQKPLANLRYTLSRMAPSTVNSGARLNTARANVAGNFKAALDAAPKTSPAYKKAEQILTRAGYNVDTGRFNRTAVVKTGDLQAAWGALNNLRRS